MIVMLLSVVWGRIQERTRNFGHLVHETWPRTCVRSVFKLYKKQTKSENHETCWDVVISYSGGYDKNFKTFRARCPRTMLANRRISKEVSWFREEGDEVVSIVRDNLREIFSNFYHSLRIWYHDILTSFMIFELRLLFIEFKNNSTASSWSCFVNKMFEIGGLVLDMASHYSK